MATQRTRAAGIESGDAPTAEQSTHFNARDRLLGRLDGATVRQAAEEPAPGDGTPTLAASKAPSGGLHEH